MNVYLAAKYERREELAGYAVALLADGHDVTSRWLTGSHGPSFRAINDDERRVAAEEDLEDIDRASAMVAFTGSGGRGGRHVETGYALAQGMTILLVGAPENVFHYLPSVEHVADWPAARRRLREIENERAAMWAEAAEEIRSRGSAR